jgi:hypothetical protein
MFPKFEGDAAPVYAAVAGCDQVTQVESEATVDFVESGDLKAYLEAVGVEPKKAKYADRAWRKFLAMALPNDMDHATR